MRARDPDQEGHVKRGSVRVFWERYGAGEPDASTAMLHPALDAVAPAPAARPTPVVSGVGRSGDVQLRGNDQLEVLARMRT